MSIAIGTYVEMLERDGTATGYRFQNFFQGETRSYNGKTYVFGAFGFSGGTLDLQAGSVSANLIFALNDLALTVFNQAVVDRWLIEIHTVWLNPDTLAETGSYSEELYSVIGLEHDTSRLSIRLGNPLDAVTENAPRRLLTQALVGNLPSTGNINLR
jgi:hypothetical protein